MKKQQLFYCSKLGSFLQKNTVSLVSYLINGKTLSFQQLIVTTMNKLHLQNYSDFHYLPLANIFAMYCLPTHFLTRNGKGPF